MKKFDHNEAEIYDKKIRLAIPEYDLFHGLLCSLASLIINKAEAQKSEKQQLYPRALVVGAGTGYEVINLLKKCENLIVDALEPAEQMREIFEQHLLQESLNSRVNIFPDTLQSFLAIEKYDLVTSILVLHFIPTTEGKEQFIKKMSDLLNKNGKIVIFEMMKTGDLDEFMSELWGQRLRDSGVLPETVSGMQKNIKEKFYPMVESDLEQMANKAGLKMNSSFYQILNFKAYIFEKN